ncbi:MAG: L-rhamnose mutarotase [bacterium]|nr:L-rhamnose mutarotase [bacterium]
MENVAFKMQLHHGQVQEYQRRHDEIWPELVALLKNTGVIDYSIFLDPSTNALFAVLKMESPALLDELSKHPIVQKWWKYMSDIMETNPDYSPLSTPLKEVFYLP